MAEFTEQQREILDEALAEFKRGCGGDCSLAADFATAFDKHYGVILETHEEEIVAARKGKAAWEAALQAVRDTGARAAEKAKEGSATGDAEISADHFSAACAEVEAEKADDGSNWCGVTGADPTA